MLYYIWGAKMQELETLKGIIKEKDLSQEKLARALGVSLNTVIRWFQNKSKPSDLALIQIRKFINKHKRRQT